METHFKEGILRRSAPCIPHCGFPLSGKWLVSYDRNQFTWSGVWESLLAIQSWLEEKGFSACRRKTVLLKGEGASIFRTVGGAIHLEAAKDSVLDFREEQRGQGRPAWSFPASPIRRVALVFFRSAGEPRWEKVRLPSTLLALAAPLHAAGFQVDVTPAPGMEEGQGPLAQADLVGLTLYEDNFNEAKEFLSLSRGSANALFAVGGPLLTLAPAAAVYHLPEAHLFVRGEADSLFPPLLHAVGEGDPEALFREKGFVFHRDGLLLISDFDHIPRPSAAALAAVPFSLDFADRQHLECGLEVNFSRGCRRGCLFCSRIHGGRLRRMPLARVRWMLEAYRRRVRELGINGDLAWTVNLNDDDILQDGPYARGVFSLIKRAGLRIFGVQTALASLIAPSGLIERDILVALADKALYAGGSPLLWIGSDLFLAARAKRLGKPFPPLPALEELFAIFEEKGVRHYHYWISSDADSDWEEFAAEIGCIIDFAAKYTDFGLLAHAPFVIPYASTALYRQLVQAGKSGQVKVGRILKAGHPAFCYTLVNRVETRYANLNRLLRNEAPMGGGWKDGFFDALKRRDFFRSLSVAYHFLRQERLQAEASGERSGLAKLRKCESLLEERLGAMPQAR